MDTLRPRPCPHTVCRMDSSLVSPFLLYQETKNCIVSWWPHGLLSVDGKILQAWNLTPIHLPTGCLHGEILLVIQTDEPQIKLSAPPWNQSSCCGSHLVLGPDSKSCLLVSTLYVHVKCQLGSLKYSGIYPLHGLASLFLFVYLFNKYASDIMLDVGDFLPTLGEYTAYLRLGTKPPIEKVRT